MIFKNDFFLHPSKSRPIERSNVHINQAGNFIISPISLIELSKSTLTNIEGYSSEDADLEITLNRSDLDLVMMGVKSLDELIAEGTAKTEGDRSIIDQLKSNPKTLNYVSATALTVIAIFIAIKV